MHAPTRTAVFSGTNAPACFARDGNAEDVARGRAPLAVAVAAAMICARPNGGIRDEHDAGGDEEGERHGGERHRRALAPEAHEDGRREAEHRECGLAEHEDA